jgi:hypothetical protein
MALPDPAGLDDVLMTLVIEFLFFLENSSADEVQPAAADRMTAEIAFQLGRLDPHELAPLVLFIHQQAEHSAWPEERSFLQKLPGYLGLE